MEWELLDDEMEKVTSILGGFRCHICGKEVKLKRRILAGDSERGVGFMRIAMGEHLKVHIHKGEVKNG